MEIPREIKMFCKWCGKHNTHTVEKVKKKPQRAMAQGQRRFKRSLAGYGSFPKPMPSGKKPTQRQDLRYKCKECKKSTTRRKSYRTKKFSLKE